MKKNHPKYKDLIVLFGARLPVDEKTKAWIDRSFQRLEMLFGKDRMLCAEIILPIDQYFPDKYEKNEVGLEVLFRRVCEYMGVARTTVELSMIPDHVSEIKEHLPAWSGQSSEPVGLYSPAEHEELPLVSVRESTAQEPMVAVAVMAHELAHVILLGENLIDAEGEDMEPFTDLATVYLGLGIFSANAAFRYQRHETYRKKGWSVSKSGYLSEEQFGYALAKFAFERGERKPEWAKHLASNIRIHFNDAVKWLAKNDSKYPG